MFLHIESARYLGGYRLRLEFNNGMVKDVDLQGELDGQIFEPLRDVSYFSRVFVNPDTRTIEWENGADLAPEFLDEIGTRVELHETMAA